MNCSINILVLISEIIFNSRTAIAEAIIGLLLVFLQFKEFELYWGAVFLQFKEFELYWGAVFFFLRSVHTFS